MLAVNNLDPAQAPFAVPAHFTLNGDHVVLHLARPNPVWPHLEAAAQVRLAVVGDDAYVPSYWRAKAGGPDEDGVPTSYYTSLQFVCRPTVVDDPQGKVDILTTQFADIQPEGQHATVTVDAPPYGRMLSGIRGIRSIDQRSAFRPASRSSCARVTDDDRAAANRAAAAFHDPPTIRIDRGSP